MSVLYAVKNPPPFSSTRNHSNKDKIYTLKIPPGYVQAKNSLQKTTHEAPLDLWGSREMLEWADPLWLMVFHLLSVKGLLKNRVIWFRAKTRYDKKKSQSYYSYCEKKSCLNDVYVRCDKPPARGTGQDEVLDNGEQGQGHLGWVKRIRDILVLMLELNSGQLI